MEVKTVEKIAAIVVTYNPDEGLNKSTKINGGDGTVEAPFLVE